MDGALLISCTTQIGSTARSTTSRVVRDCLPAWPGKGSRQEGDDYLWLAPPW